jgi:uncharacterized protein (TIGR03435 family)
MQKSVYVAVLSALVAPLAAAPPQTLEPSALQKVPAFEVVSVKANRSNAEGQNMRLQPGGRAVITNSPLRPIILLAYALLPQQLLGGPNWIDTDRFDIVAQARENLEGSPPGGPPGKAQLMLQRLLAERFGLVVHTETREQPIYALTVVRDDGRLGPRMAPAKADCMALMAAYGRGEAPMPARSECGISGGPPRLSARGVTMPMFARSVLAGLTDRLVEDRTGLTANFDLDLEFVPGSGGAPSTSTAGGDTASLFTALEEQLGLKLRAVREPVDVVVIDRVEQPTEY